MPSRKIQIGVLIVTTLLVTMACSAVTTSSTPTAAASGNCPALPAPQLTKSGFVDDVVLAKNTEGEEKNPTGLTSVFGPTDVFHAVLKLVDAPENTSFSATWYVTDVGPDVACNSTIDSTEISTGGTRNLDFTLTPNDKWPTGTYRVEIFVNGVLEDVREFSVQ